ncbi:MAG: hypothetical protein R3Y54_13420, partial [Eubacteriales bacterium]
METYTGGNCVSKGTWISIGSTESIFLLSRAYNSAYYFRVDSTSRLTIVRRRAHLSAISVLENTYNNKPILEEITIPLDTALLSTANITWNFDNDDRCLYITTASAITLTANSTFLITKIEFDTWEVTQYTMTNTTGITLGTSGRTYAYVHQRFILLSASASPYVLWQLEVGNSANVEAYTMYNENTFQGLPQYGMNGRVYYDKIAGYVHVAKLDKKEVVQTEQKQILFSTNNNYPTYGVPFLDEPMLLYYASSSSSVTAFFQGIAQLTNYLATINNLSEPVAKTADKTMKITYIIQEV